MKTCSTKTVSTEIEVGEDGLCVDVDILLLVQDPEIDENGRVFFGGQYDPIEAYVTRLTTEHTDILRSDDKDGIVFDILDKLALQEIIENPSQLEADWR